MTHGIAENHFMSELYIWVIVMTHWSGVLKTSIRNNVFPNICVGGAIKMQKF